MNKFKNYPAGIELTIHHTYDDNKNNSNYSRKDWTKLVYDMRLRLKNDNNLFNQLRYLFKKYFKKWSQLGCPNCSCKKKHIGRCNYLEYEELCDKCNTVIGYWGYGRFEPPMTKTKYFKMKLDQWKLWWKERRSKWSIKLIFLIVIVEMVLLLLKIVLFVAGVEDH